MHAGVNIPAVYFNGKIIGITNENIFHYSQNMR